MKIMSEEKLDLILNELKEVKIKLNTVDTNFEQVNKRLGIIEKDIKLSLKMFEKLDRKIDKLEASQKSNSFKLREHEYRIEDLEEKVSV